MMKCARAEPRVSIATILRKTTYWTKPELVDQAIHQQYQKMKIAKPLVAREPTVRTLSVSKDGSGNLFEFIRSTARARKFCGRGLRRSK